MTVKLVIKKIFIFTIFALLWNQQNNYLSQKIALENSYRDKIVSSLSRILSQEKFIVIVNVEMSTVGGVLKKTPKPQSGSNIEPSNGYTPIPGLPTVPSSEGNSFNNSSNKNLGNNYSIGKINVNISLDENLATSSIKQKIKKLIEQIVPETSGCDDCIKIESIEFAPSIETQKIEALMKEIDELKTIQRKAEEGALKKELENAEDELKAAQEARKASEQRNIEREKELERRDALAHARLVEFEKSRNAQDSIRNINTENELRRVRESKIRSDSTIISETMGIVKKQIGGNESNEDASLFSGSSGSSTVMNYVLVLFLIIALMFVTYLAANNKKPNTIYLKPKKPTNKKNKELSKPKEVENKKSENSDDNLTADDSPKELNNPESQSLKPNEDIINSELKSMRQTAVAMSVGEKESASALIKEWLADNPNKEETKEEAEEE